MPSRVTDVSAMLVATTTCVATGGLLLWVWMCWWTRVCVCVCVCVCGGVGDGGGGGGGVCAQMPACADTPGALVTRAPAGAECLCLCSGFLAETMPPFPCQRRTLRTPRGAASNTASWCVAGRPA
jgi:hypothetical protein